MSCEDFLGLVCGLCFNRKRKQQELLVRFIVNQTIEMSAGVSSETKTLPSFARLSGLQCKLYTSNCITLGQTMKLPKFHLVALHFIQVTDRVELTAQPCVTEGRLHGCCDNGT